jgi:hypothetical protein
LTDYKKGKWTPLEDKKLQDAVDRVGTADFHAVAHFVPNRCYIQCKDRFDLLRAGEKYSTSVSSKWSDEETALLQNGLIVLVAYM